MSATVIEIIGQQGPQGPQGPGPDFADANITTTGTLSAGAGSVISGNTATPALRVTQEGSGNALEIEDDVHPDNTPLIVNNLGQIISGVRTAFSGGAGLQITADSNTAPNGSIVVRRCGNEVAGAVVSIQKARGTSDNVLPAENGDSLGALTFVGFFDPTTNRQGARIVANVDGAVSTNSVPASLRFETRPVGDTEATPTERMRIDSAGNVGIGTTANAAAILDVSSTTKGFLPPRMTEVERDAIATPPAGLMIYNTTTNKLNFYNGTAWEAVTSS
jgi:hypothetical protein